MIKLDKCPFYLFPLVFLRHWYSIESKGYRLSIAFGTYREFYYFKTSIGGAIKRRYAFHIGEIILMEMK